MIERAQVGWRRDDLYSTIQRGIVPDGIRGTIRRMIIRDIKIEFRMGLIQHRLNHLVHKPDLVVDPCIDDYLTHMIRCLLSSF